MKYFGTDGIRGRANEKLTPELAFKVGRYLGYELAKDNDAKFLIGRDTRKSGQMLESALASGLMASGCNVDLLGVVVTPLVSFLLENNDYVGGIMISASHNVYSDNGLKIMDEKGLKIDPFLQDKIESYLDGNIEIPYRLDDRIGIVNNRETLSRQYVDYLKKNFTEDLSNYRIAVDAANGSASFLAEFYREFNLDVEIINNQPNGLNINDKCGSTHMESLTHFMANQDFDLGVAFDGDGDRIMLIDDNCNLIDGDGIIYTIANYYQQNNMLESGSVVVTVMSNLGLHKALSKLGIKSVITDVGDKNVLDRMLAENHLIGGEQSGHIILREFSSMGDSFVVSLEILNIMAKAKKKFSQLNEALKIYPQELVNIKVKDTSEILNDLEVISIIDKVSADLNDDGRVLVRASGTEPLIRVMVEAESEEIVHNSIMEIMEVINQKI